MAEALQLVENPAKSLGPKAKQASFDLYSIRFKNARWMSLLKEFLGLTGPALDGHMAQYNDVKNTQVSIPTLFRYNYLMIFRK